MSKYERKILKINDKKYELYLPYYNLSSKNRGSDYNELKSAIIYFVTVMATECKYFDIDKFLEKIKDTEFINISDQKNRTFNGEFLPDENKIVYVDIPSLIHELIHFSTSFNGPLCGFVTLDEDGNEIGKGINEGYTDYIFSRYFYKNNSPYCFEVLCVQHIEYLIGRKLWKHYSLKVILMDL